jgi:hypothetical protein
MIVSKCTRHNFQIDCPLPDKETVKEILNDMQGAQEACCFDEDGRAIFYIHFPVKSRGSALNALYKVNDLKATNPPKFKNMLKRFSLKKNFQYMRKPVGLQSKLAKRKNFAYSNLIEPSSSIYSPTIKKKVK